MQREARKPTARPGNGKKRSPSARTTRSPASSDGRHEARRGPPDDEGDDGDGPSFGRRFFVDVLGALVRDRCPDPSERLPRVFVHVMGGDVLEVCRIQVLAPRWASFSVIDDENETRTELVPYGTIVRITITAGAPDAPIGFRGDEPAPPLVSTPAPKSTRTARRVGRRRTARAPRSH